jgi:hypothetical protein
MPNIFNFTALRSADELSPKEVDKLGIKTHPENLQSERYRNWLTFCESQNYQSLKTEMTNFLNSEVAIKKLSQMPKDIAPIIKFAEYNGFKGFDIKDFVKQIDLRKMPNEFGKEIKEDGCYNEKTPFFNLITNLNDQLLAETKIGINVKRDYNILGAIKTAKLAEAVYLVGKEKIRLNIYKHYSKPIIINSCILEINHCSNNENFARPLPNREEKSMVQKDENNEKDCRCKEQNIEDECECKCNDECVEQNPCCVEIKPYIAELFVVRDEICKYEPADISYIKNIVKGETQERIHRDLEKETNYTETIDETKKFEEQFLEVTDKSSINSTIEDIIKDETKVHAGATYGKKDGPGYFVEGSFDFKRNRDRTNKIVKDVSKDVIDRMTSRLEKNTKITNQITLHRETEITNTSRFEGVGSDLSRQYFNVKQTRKAQVFSEGMRTMLDFYVAEPAELLKRLIEKQFKRKKPEKPCINIENISPSDYMEYVQCYGFTDLENPPEQPPIQYRHYTMGVDFPDETLNIPEGYRATRMEYSGGHSNRKAGRSNARMTISVGSYSISNYWKEGADDPVNMNSRGTLTVKVSDDGCNDNARISVKITLTPDPVDNLPWQLEVHKLLMEKYQNELDEYNRALADFQKQKENYYNKSEFVLSETIKMQLKQAAISYISCQFFDDNDAMKNKVKGCGFPQMDLPETKKEGEFVRFFEQAFEWQYMNYMLYPYFWSRKCSWEDKLKQDADNYLFKRFLEAGFARITISVRPGFEDFVNYYLQTRQIWNGGEPPILGVGFLPIHQEIKESKNNYNADRTGIVKWDSSLNKDEILLYNNLDYYTEDIDPVTGNPLGTYSFDPDLAKVDLNREININCVTYRIVSIDEVDATNDVVKFKLDRELEVDCCCSGNGKEFDDIYDNRELTWSTGAIFIGAPWKYSVPTSLIWLREEGGCLPCYPIKCEE